MYITIYIKGVYSNQRLLTPSKQVWVDLKRN